VADATQIRAVKQSIEELRARVVDARAAYGDVPAVRRLANDVERLMIDADELEAATPAVPPPTPPKIAIDDTPLDPAMWGDADDEGVGGFHGITSGATRSGSQR
jgi:hypothetical protein